MIYRKIPSQKQFIAHLCALSAISLSGTFASAQTAGQLVEETYAPPIIRSASGGLRLTGDTTIDVPQGAEILYVRPSALEVDGGFAGLTQETTAIEATIKNKRVSAADLFAAAKALEAAYAAKGYILARVTLPPQTIEDGKPLKLLVTDGFIQEIDASNLPPHVQPKVHSLLERLANKRQLTKSEMERQMLLVADIPGLLVSSTLKAGTAPGATILVLSGKHRSTTTTLSTDNSLSPALSTFPLNISTDVNNYLGLGDVFYVRLGGYPGFAANVIESMPRNRQAIVGFTVPLGDNGWWFNIEGVDSRTNPKSGQLYNIEDHFQRLSIGVGYHWIRSREFNTSTNIAFETSDADQTMHFGGRRDWAKDKFRSIQITQSFDAFLPWQASIRGKLMATFGLDAFGARHPTIALPMTRDGASPAFQKLAFTLGYDQQFGLDSGRDLQLNVTARGQTSFGAPLGASEQMGLGSPDWMSSMHSGSIQGDSALSMRAELAYPFTLDSFSKESEYITQLSPYVFAAGGVSKLEASTAIQSEVIGAMSVGLGLRYGLSQSEKMQGISLSLEYAHGQTTASEETNRFNFKLVSTF